MNIKNIIGSAALGFAILTGANAINAQDTQTQQQQKTEKQGKLRGEGFGKRGGFRGGRHGGGEMKMFAQLNLTDAQKEQMRQIAERNRDSNRALFEQMRALKDSTDTTARENLHAQIKAARQQQKAEMLSVLTAEQKTQLEQLKAERKQLREQRRQQFEQRRQQRQNQTQTATPNIN